MPVSGAPGELSIYHYVPRLGLLGSHLNNASFLIYTNGACRGNGTPGAQASFGVWFGHPDSPYNCSAVLDRKAHRMTNQYAELYAVFRALRVVRHHIEQQLWTQFRVGKVAVATDSAYVVNCMTRWISKWKANGWINSKGGTVVNSPLIQRIDRLVASLEGYGICVKFEHVPREQNAEADRLANEVLPH